MSTETVPPSSAESLPGGAPPVPPGADADADVAQEAGEHGPRIDVAELTRFLDGRYTEVRNLVRVNLAEKAEILEQAETLSRDEFRERVRDVDDGLDVSGDLRGVLGAVLGRGSARLDGHGVRLPAGPVGTRLRERGRDPAGPPTAARSSWG